MKSDQNTPSPLLPASDVGLLCFQRYYGLRAGTRRPVHHPETGFNGSSGGTFLVNKKSYCQLAAGQCNCSVRQKSKMRERQINAASSGVKAS